MAFYDDPAWGPTTGAHAIDWGFDNSDSDSFRCFVRVQFGAPDVRVVPFAFAGIDGVGMQTLGKAARVIVWSIDAVFKTQDAFTDFEDSLNYHKRNKTYDMTARGHTFKAVQLAEANKLGDLEYMASPYTVGVRYQLIFEELAP